jgi:hypothetical protein
MEMVFYSTGNTGNGCRCQVVVEGLRGWISAERV